MIWLLTTSCTLHVTSPSSQILPQNLSPCYSCPLPTGFFILNVPYLEFASSAAHSLTSLSSFLILQVKRLKKKKSNAFKNFAREFSNL